MAKKQIATFLGPNPGLVITGEHCYAYNTAPASETPSNILEFTTGKQYIVGTIQLNANVKASDPASGAITTLAVTFNGTTIFILKATASDDKAPSTAICDIIIPPLTSVVASIDSSSNTATYIGSAVLVGRVYA